MSRAEGNQPGAVQQPKDVTCKVLTAPAPERVRGRRGHQGPRQLSVQHRLRVRATVDFGKGSSRCLLSWQAADQEVEPLLIFLNPSLLRHPRGRSQPEAARLRSPG